MDVDALEPTVAEKPSQRTPRIPRFQFLPIVMLVLCCVLWGFSFPIAQRSTAIMESVAGPDLATIARPAFNGLRFTVAAIVYLLLTLPRQRGFARADILGGASTGAFFTAGMFLQLTGLRYVTPSVSAFLTALAVVFTPLAQSLLLKRGVSGRMWLSVILACGGTLLLSLPAPSAAASAGSQSCVQTPPVPFLGEILTTLGAVMFSAQILALDRYGQSAQASRLTLIMFAACGILSILVACLWGGASLFSPAALKTLAGDFQFAWMFAALVVLCSVFAMHLMNRYQPLIAPAAATVIYCLEPVFATMYSCMLGAEALTLLTLVGGGIILLAVLLIAKAE